MNKEHSNRIFYLDVLRVIACLAVIIIHTSSSYVTKNIGSINFWVGNTFDGLARIGVPLFVMISGALMLDKNYDFSTKKQIGHIKKMIVFFVFWSALYCIVLKIIGPLVKGNPIDLISVFKAFITGHRHLWFVYLIVGLYLIVPLLRLWVKDENKKFIEYFLILSIIFTFIIPQIVKIGSYYYPTLQSAYDLTLDRMHLQYIGGYTVYFILGWYINNYDFKDKKLIYWLGILGVVISVVGTYMVAFTYDKTVQVYDNLYINVLLQAIAMFTFIKSRFVNKPSNDNSLITSISKYSLGIYAIHDIIISILYKITDKIGFDYAIVKIPIIFLIAFIISFFASFVMNKIPVLKKLV